MSIGTKKDEVISFKVDAVLAKALAGIRNRSDFIRGAVLSALGTTCPLCHGSGSLSVSGMQHWQDFTAHHHLRTCEDCREPRLVCDMEEGV